MVNADPEPPVPPEERPWEDRMMDWAREAIAAQPPAAVAGEEDAAGTAAPGDGQPHDALSPIDFARDKREFDEFPLHSLLGLTLEELRAGYARICLLTGRVTLGGVGASVHGGLLAAMVDIAMLEALVPLLQQGEKPAGTVDLNITYLRPALGARVYAAATVLRKGRTTVVTEVSITDSGGKLCAKGRTIYALRQDAG